jgi:Leucine-rich repeat (LRR) protein
MESGDQLMKKDFRTKKIISQLLALVLVLTLSQVIHPEPAAAGEDTTPPTWSNAVLNYTDLTHDNVTLEWTPAEDLNGIVNYSVYQVTGIDQKTYIDTVSGSVYCYTVSDLNPETEYQFKIEAVDPSENWSTDGPSISLTTLDPNDFINFPDLNLEDAVLNALNQPVGPIARADLEALSALNATERGITDLTGLEHAVNLKRLYLGYNQISDLTPLAGLTSLEELWLNHNDIFDDNNNAPLSNLSSLTKLKWLYLNNNHIYDIMPLFNLPNLQTLNLNDNYIEDVSPLASLTSLWGLSLGYNNISNINPLQTLVNLQSLDLQAQGYWLNEPDWVNVPYDWWEEPILTDISAVKKMPHLQNLLLNDNNITNLTPLEGLMELKLLTLWNNGITDDVNGGITPLAGLTGLTDLWLDFVYIEILTPLANLPNLEVLSLAGNYIINDISPLINSAGLGQGDYVYLPSEIPSIDEVKEALENKGINVTFRASVSWQ